MNLSNIRDGIRMAFLPLDTLNWLRVEKLARIKKNEWAFLCNGHIGETYYTCGLIEAFRKAHNNDPVVVVIPKKYLPITRMFPAVSRVMVGHCLPIPFASIYVSLRKPKRGQLLQALSSPGYGYKGLNFLDSFKMALNLPPNSKFSAPRLPSRAAIAVAGTYLSKAGLRPGKTAILFIHAQSSKSLSSTGWLKISRRLKAMGWDVATSTIGGINTVEGTVPLRFSLSDAVAIVEASGWFIAIRSGICDLLSSSKCKKTVLYLDHEDYHNIGEFKVELNKFRMIAPLGLLNTTNLKELEIRLNPTKAEVCKALV